MFPCTWGLISVFKESDKKAPKSIDENEFALCKIKLTKVGGGVDC